ncbi:MAG: RHS repeat-associated core domain-containing protein, partial [Bacteroidota bacterium]
IDWKNIFSTINQKQSYTYSYDKLDRLKKAEYDNYLSQTNFYSVTGDAKGIRYDLNGNIKNLQRTSNQILVDNLSFDYSSGGNQLQKVTDSGSSELFDNGTSGSAIDYTYDDNGNLEQDKNKDIASITYNHLNLPETIIFYNGDEVRYAYDATGIKREKIVTLGANTETYHYIGGFQYKNQELQFLSLAEGRYVFDADAPNNNRFEFHLKDHLGNVRATVYDENGSLQAVSADDYYPGGLVFNSYRSGTKNNYLNQGKERQEELGLDDFGARFYDPAIMRWQTIDPMADALASWTPYNYALGNPILFIDPDGEFPYTFHIRSFHPDATFGGGFMGDNRGFSNDPSSSARIAQRFTFDPSTGQSSNRGFDSNFSMHPAGFTASTTGQAPLPPSMFIGHENPNETHFDVTGKNGSYNISTGYEGANPLTPGLLTPDIDVHSNFSITEDLDNGVLSIGANITGDNFPNAEAFLVDQSGKNSVFIGVSSLSGSVLTSLWGDNYREMINAYFNINIDNNGNFTGVSMGDQTFSLEEWNSQFNSIQD